MDKEKSIIDFLRNKYNPTAIILHGSRAVKMERKNSDWDIFMIFKNEIPRSNFREEIDNEDVEWKAFKMPIDDKNILSTFDVYLQNARVIWEKDNDGSNLIESAKKVYSHGPNLTKDDIEREKIFLKHKLNGMIDDIDTPYMFLRHLNVFFNRASNMWFEIINNKFPMPYYLAMPKIQEEDSEFALNLLILSSNNSNQEKINAAEKIIKRLFL